MTAASAGRVCRHCSAWRRALEPGSTKSGAPRKGLGDRRLAVRARLDSGRAATDASAVRTKIVARLADLWLGMVQA
jgi:hypothetical protein